MSSSPKKPSPPAAPAAPDAPKPASQGGSFVVGRDGKPVRQEHTRQPGDPDHEANVTPAADPAKET